MKKQTIVAGLYRWRSAVVVSLVLAVFGSIFLWNSFAATPISAAACDLNGDGKINLTDLSLLLSNWNKTATRGDINGDGKVNLTDLSLLLSNWNKTVAVSPSPPPAPTPTPTPTPTPPPPSGTSPYLAPGISKGIVEDNNGSISQDASDMKNVGITWDRGWMECGGASSVTGMVNSLRSSGVTFLPTYNCGINTSIATYKSQLAADVRALAPLGVHVWEIGNEMDGGWTAENNYCDNNNTPGQMDCAEKAYLPFLQAAFETVHANDPQGVVVYGGLSSYDVNLGPWLKAMEADQAWQWMDGMGFHPYGNSISESMSSMTTLQSYMSKHPAWQSKPIWITEYGCWSSGLGSNQNSPCSPQNESGKASYLTGMMDALKAWNKGTPLEIRTPLCWYILHESGSTPGYGLVQTTNPRTYFQAYTSYKNYTF